MAKSKKKKSGVDMKLIMNIIIIALAILTVCTLFMPIFKSIGYLVGKQVGDATVANGADAFSAAFAGEWSSDMSAGTSMLYGYKAAEDTAFITTVALWGYMLTVIVSVASLVFAVLNILGLKFKLINTILGVALIALAVLTFILAIVAASQNTTIETGAWSGEESGNKVKIAIGMYMLIATLIAGGAQVYNARQK